MSSLILMLLVKGQKVKGVGPSTLEERVRDREQEPARMTITTSFGHDVDI